MVRAAASRRTWVENRSRRNEKPTPASASSVVTPPPSSWLFQVRREVSQGTNSG